MPKSNVVHIDDYRHPRLGSDIMLVVEEIFKAEEMTRNYHIVLKDMVNDDILDCQLVTTELKEEVDNSFIEKLQDAITQFKTEIYETWGDPRYVAEKHEIVKEGQEETDP